MTVFNVSDGLSIIEMAEYVTSSPRWDGCDLTTLLNDATDEEIRDAFEMLKLEEFEEEV